MNTLREQMTADLQPRGLSDRTQEAYLRAVRQLADHYGTPPDQLDERLKPLAEDDGQRAGVRAAVSPK